MLDVKMIRNNFYRVKRDFVARGNYELSGELAARFENGRARNASELEMLLSFVEREREKNAGGKQRGATEKAVKFDGDTKSTEKHGEISGDSGQETLVRVPVLEKFLELDKQYREKLSNVENLRAKLNAASKAVGAAKARGLDSSAEFAAMRALSDEVKLASEELKEMEAAINTLLSEMQNILSPDVPPGVDEKDNRVVREWGEPRRFSFAPQAHWDIGTYLDIIDFERAAKIAGARFSILKGAGALLERALIGFMLDLHTKEHGYTEVLPPFIVNSSSMFGTGQLPKFRADLFKLEGFEYFLVPTAEVPVTNIHAGEILKEEELPVCYCAYTPCFRSEAGSYGKDTKGMMRQHQFDKVELVKLVHPDKSYEEHEKLTRDAERVLQLLELPYRVVILSSGDTGAAAAKCYDIEVWLPSEERYREISSCSNFEDFQARRANIRFRPADGSKVRFVHTMNGSGLAIGRTLIAIIENYQQEDGTVIIPKVLHRYTGGLEKILPPSDKAAVKR